MPHFLHLKWLTSHGCLWNKMVHGPLQQGLAWRGPSLSQRPWILHWWDHSPTASQHGPMDCHGTRMVVFTSFFGILAKMRRNLEPPHQLLFPILQFYLNYHVFILKPLNWEIITKLLMLWGVTLGLTVHSLWELFIMGIVQTPVTSCAEKLSYKDRAYIMLTKLYLSSP